MRPNDRSCWWLLGLVLVLAPASSLTSGCSDTGRDGVTGQGTLRMPLGAQGASGAMYRLRSAALSATGPVDTVVYSEDHLSAQSVVFDLPAGSYELTVAGEWWLERQTASGYVPVEARLLSENPSPFEILTGMVTVLTLSFRVDGEVAQMGPGTVIIRVDVDDSGTGVGGEGQEAGAGGVGGASGGAGGASGGAEGGTAGEEDPGDAGAAGAPDTCGDGVLDADEECDDGADGDPCDGCLDSCETHPIPAPGPVMVPSVIDEDTVWCAEQSPVALTGNTAVMPGAGLYIGAGVEVRVSDGVGLQVRGELRAIGTESAPVVFTSAGARPGRGSWGGIFLVSGDGGRAVLRHSVVEYSHSGLRESSCCQTGSLVQDSTFRHNNQGLSLRLPVFSGLEFIDNGLGMEGNRAFVHASLFSENDVGLQSGWGSAIDSIFVRNGVAISHAARVERCLIADNQSGVREMYVDLIDNTIVRNGVGVDVSSGFELRGNTFCANGSYDLRNFELDSVDAASNWWCSTDPTFISGRIVDFFDDFNLGPVLFEPFLTAPSPDAPADPGPP